MDDDQWKLIMRKCMIDYAREQKDLVSNTNYRTAVMIFYYRAKLIHTASIAGCVSVFPFHFQYLCNFNQKVLLNCVEHKTTTTIFVIRHLIRNRLSGNLFLVLWVKCELSSSSTHHHCGQVYLLPLRGNEDKQHVNQHYVPEHHPHGTMLYLIFCRLHDLLEYFCIFTFFARIQLRIILLHGLISHLDETQMISHDITYFILANYEISLQLYSYVKSLRLGRRLIRREDE